MVFLGVLDEFLRVAFNPFDIMIGTSAGTQNLSACLCQQRGYAYQVITQYTIKSQFFNPLRFIRGGHVIDLEWLIDVTSRDLPLDFSTGLACLDGGRQFLISACCYNDFSPVYFSQHRRLVRYYSGIKCYPGILSPGGKI